MDRPFKVALLVSQPKKTARFRPTVRYTLDRTMQSMSEGIIEEVKDFV